MRGFAVAIDGPVGVGKSTVAQEVAKNLGMTYIDTGAMYRAVALFKAKCGDKEATIESILEKIDIRLESKDGAQRIFLNGEDVSEQIRTQEISEAASRMAVLEPIRKKLVSMQQDLAKTGRVVMDGRDIASRVLPRAQVKIYLDASPEIRAARRFEDLRAKGIKASLDEILEQTIIRDERDMNRELSPLVQTEDAVYICTDSMRQPDVVQAIIELVREKEGTTCSIVS